MNANRFFATATILCFAVAAGGCATTSGELQAPPAALTPATTPAYAQSCVRGGQQYTCPIGKVVAITATGEFQCRLSWDKVPFAKPGEKPCVGIQ